jgi:hypothetical protein
MSDAGVPTEYEHGPGYTVSTWRNALLMLWSGEITSHALDVTERAGRFLERHYKDQVAVSISMQGVPIPSDAVRTHAARLLRERAPVVRLSVTVIEGDGFWLSAGRMVMTALVGLSGGKSKPVIAKNLDEAAPLIHPHVTPKATLNEVVQALRAFRGA